MKWYNKEIMQKYKFDVSYPTQSNDRVDELIQHFATWTPKLAITFSREYAAIGTLDLNDLVGFANLHMIIAVNNFDWEHKIKVTGIKDAWVQIKDIKPEDQAAVIWKYVKKTVLLSIRDEINLHKDGMRIYREGDPGRKMVKKGESAQEDFITQLFPDFFNEEYVNLVDPYEVSAWDIEQLAVGLEVLMDETLSFKEKDILKSFYGIDCDKMSQLVLANYYKMNYGALRKNVSRSIMKLKDLRESKNIIQKYYEI